MVKVRKRLFGFVVGVWMCLARFVVSCFLSYFGCLILFDSVYLSLLIYIVIAKVC